MKITKNLKELEKRIIGRSVYENDALALSQVQAMFPERRVVGVATREIAYGGGNIHCITQQLPRA